MLCNLMECMEIAAAGENPRYPETAKSQYLEIPEGLVEGYGGHSKRAPATPEVESVIGVDDGPRPSIPTAKRPKLGSPAKLPLRISPQSNPLHDGQCCNCTKVSTCRRRCECQKANQQCQNCDCFDKCKNKFDRKKAPCQVIDNTPPQT
jgi:hypothetical protein